MVQLSKLPESLPIAEIPQDVTQHCIEKLSPRFVFTLCNVSKDNNATSIVLFSVISKHCAWFHFSFKSENFIKQKCNFFLTEKWVEQILDAVGLKVSAYYFHPLLPTYALRLHDLEMFIEHVGTHFWQHCSKWEMLLSYIYSYHAQVC